jgi:hypothetical protein
MRYSEKYPDDMLENLAESPWTCSDGLGSALNEIPKGVSFLEREQEREREEVDLGRVGEEKGLHLHPTPWDPPTRGTRGQSAAPRGPSARCADGSPPRRGLSVICSRTTSAAPPPHEPRGRSAPPWRTVRQEWPDSPAHCRRRSDLPFQF